jgi:hypothetical protein
MAAIFVLPAYVWVTIAVLTVAIPDLSPHGLRHHWAPSVRPMPLNMRDVLWVSNPRNWLIADGDYGIDFRDFTREDYEALLDDAFPKLPRAYWHSLVGARSRAHFNYKLERALQHLEVSRRLQDAHAPELFLAVGAWAALAIITLTAMVFLRRRRAYWWNIDRSVRLALVVGAVWAVTFFLLLDEANLKIVLLPPLALIALSFAYRHLVDAPAGSHDPEH